MIGGRGIGRGRGRRPPEPQEQTSSSGGVGRGRGRGALFFDPSDDEDDEGPPPPPTSRGVSRRPDPPPNVDVDELLSFLSDDSDEEDDFIASFRRLQSGGGLPPPVRGRGSEQRLPTRGTHAASSSHFRQAAEDFDSASTTSSSSSMGVPEVPISSPSPVPSSSGSGSGGRSSGGSERVVVRHKGEKGKGVNLCVNYIPLIITNESGTLFEYHVDFFPEIGSKKLKRSILRGTIEHIGQVFDFDGAKLYLPIKLPHKKTKFTTDHPAVPNTSVEVQIKFVKENSFASCTHFFNILLRRIMFTLGYIELQRNFYDYRRVFEIPEHKLDIWPGFVTAIDDYEDGLMLLCDTSSRVLRRDTMLTAILNMKAVAEQERERGRYEWQQKFKEYAVGKIVLTKYNNKNYRIDDVRFDKTPQSTFTQTRRGQDFEVSFINYYRERYGITIEEKDQPLLLSRAKVRRQIHVNDFSLPEDILLVPELCNVTGMTEEITENYRTMKVLAEKTRLVPMKRYESLCNFIRSVNGTPEVKRIFEDWGLRLGDGVVRVNGRVIAPPPLGVGDGRVIKPDRGEFGRELFRGCKILEPQEVGEWVLIYPQKDESKANRVVDHYRSVASPMGIRYTSDPTRVPVHRMTAGLLGDGIRGSVKKGLTRFVVVVLPSNRDDLYQQVKQICTREIPIASQVIRVQTLTDERKLRSIMQKVALQINAKMGGALWNITIPLQERIMFMGMDVYHDPRQKNASVTGLVATISPTYSKYYTRVIFQQTKTETISELRPVVREALMTYAEENDGFFPDRIVMFRDGVGDGQLELTRQHEVQAMLCSFQDLNIKPKFTFCVVQKRINTRLFLQTGSYAGSGTNVDNPEPGTVLDHTVTRRTYPDFFLVSQLIRQGTVNPTHYIVLHDDDPNPSADQIQKFAYAMSFMYYNWSGSIRVPAMCQYAHKAAGLVGQHIKAAPHQLLSKKLYYL